MKGFHWALLVLLLVSGAAAAATTTTGGPYIDFKGYLGTDNQIPNGSDFDTHMTTWYALLWVPPFNQNSTQQYFGPVPYSGPYQVLASTTETITDRVHVGGGGNGGDPTAAYRQTVGVAYLTYDASSAAADMVFTTIYGIDSNPTVPDALAMTGYSLTAPQFTMSGESVLGADGLVYDASVSQFTPIADLGSFLGSGFDLSPFQGDQSGGVYVFQTTIPVSAMAPVPEPLTMVAIGMGIAGLGGYLRRRRMASK